MTDRTSHRYAKKGIVLFFFLLFAASAFLAGRADAQSSFFSGRGCTSCHSAAGSTCKGCHFHGASNLRATPNKTTFAPGETVTVTFNGGSQSGWVRGILYRDNVEVARSSGAGGMGGGPSLPITFTTPAPTAPGSYTYAAAWFGNTANNGSTHGEVRAPSFTITVSAPGDTTAPTVSSMTPANNATNVNPGSAVTATFSEAVTNVTTSTFTLRAGGASANVSGTVTLNGAGTTATFTPSAALANGTTYTATVTTGVQDAAGNALAANRTWTFTTVAAADTTPPTVSSMAPANNATNVNPGTAVTATFSEAVTNVTTSTFTLRAGGASADLSGSVSVNGAGTTATFTPSAALAASTTYTATVTTGVRDAANNAMAASRTWTFTTAAAADTTAPTVTGTNPANNANNVAVNAAVSATFSENILSSSVTTSSFTVNGVAGAVSVSGATATFTPSAPLAFATTYTATVTTAVTDLAANRLAANRTWSFTTGAAPDTAPPTVSSTAPVNNATAVPVSSTVAATFSEAMKASTISTANFQLRQGTNDIPGTVTLNGAGTTATFQPSSPLSNSATYTATVTTGVQDAAGNAMAANRTWSFTTSAAADTSAPDVTSTTPANNAADVMVNASLTANFSESVDPLTVTAATFTLRNGTTTVPGAASASGGTATFRPAEPLANGSTYTASLTTGIKDLAGNALAASYSWSFTTGAAADTSSPTVTGTSPARDATGVPLTAAVTATFSEPLDAATVTTATFTLKDATNATVTGAVTYAGATATFAPSALAPSTTYTATLTTGIKDAASNAMAQESSWSFTTAATVVTTDTDADGALDEEDDYPDDDRIATVKEHRHHRKIKVDVSGHSGARLRRTRARTDSDASISQNGKPAGHEFRYGLVEYDVEGIAAGSTVQVKLTFPEDIPAGSKVYHVSSSGYSEVPDAAIAGRVVTLRLTDGGTGDRDLERNGVIVDPVGVASPVSAPAAGGGCSTTGAGDPDDFSGAWGALMFAGLLIALRGRRKGTAV